MGSYCEVSRVYRRGVNHAAPPYVCVSCVYERLLQQLLFK